ncbi:MAG: hypothetical protein JWP87_4813 [Labilithrix sp.]|nr:hypothetical protein [Labilithrix sp.]
MMDVATPMLTPRRDDDVSNVTTASIMLVESSGELATVTVTTH